MLALDRYIFVMILIAESSVIINQVNIYEN